MMGVFTQTSLDARLWEMPELILEHARRWQRDRWYWQAEGHPPPLHTPEGFTTDNHPLASEQAPGMRAFMRMTCPPQPGRPERPECFFLVDFEQIPMFTEAQWTESRVSSRFLAPKKRSGCGLLRRSQYAFVLEVCPNADGISHCSQRIGLKLGGHSP